MGTASFLRKAARGRRLNQSYDVSRRLTTQTIADIRARRRRLAPAVVIGLGTNDPPAAVRSFAAAVRQIMAAVVPRRCVVCPNIVRPPYRGVSYEGVNRVLAREAKRRKNLRVVDWATLVRRNPVWIGRDGVHLGPTGYRARARAVAREMERCRRSLTR